MYSSPSHSGWRGSLIDAFQTKVCLARQVVLGSLRGHRPSRHSPSVSSVANEPLNDGPPQIALALTQNSRWLTLRKP
jgi:hypothetical protein